MSQSPLPKTQIQRLQEKINFLERTIKQAEIVASESRTWTNEILLGQRPIKQAPLEMTIHLRSLAGPASDVQDPSEPQTPGDHMVRREAVLNELGSWDRRRDLPCGLRHLLCVPLHWPSSLFDRTLSV